METIFDIATPAELADIFGYGANDEDFDNYAFERRSILKSTDYNFSHLAGLYAGRGDLNKADSYIDRIKDNEMRLSTSMMIYECTY